MLIVSDLWEEVGGFILKSELFIWSVPDNVSRHRNGHFKLK